MIHGASTHVLHPIPPVFDEHSRILILGSFPSVASRDVGFFYGHKQNRFWRVLANVFGDTVPDPIPERRAFLLRHGIALWDVIASCDIVGSADSTIRSVTPNDIRIILQTAPIEAIYVNGKTAKTYYDRYLRDAVGRDAICLPSTSAANAAMRVDDLVARWRIILP